MQGYSILKTAFDKILDTGLTYRVFHSVKKFEDVNEGTTYPVYPSGIDEFTYVGIDDTKHMTVYCRQIDDLRVVKPELIASSLYNYRVAIPHRMVFFNDFEKRNQDDLLSRFIQFAFLPNIKLLRVIVDKERLANMESTAKGFNFGDETFYAAIDFEIALTLSQQNCEIELTCDSLTNPYTK